MKHYFHFLFVAGILLGSLIIFNNQNRECVTQITDNPDLVQIEFLAEICSTQTAASSLPSYRLKPEIAYESKAGNLKHLEYLNSAEHQVRSKTQMQIHLELLPVFGIQSGQYHHHYSRSDDPPLS